jgi:hypothetical protein
MRTAAFHGFIQGPHPAFQLGDDALGDAATNILPVSFFVLIHVFVVLWVWVFSQDASGNVRGAVSSYPQDAQARVAP